MEVLFKEVTLNREPEAVVELNAAELTKTLWVWFYARFYKKKGPHPLNGELLGRGDGGEQQGGSSESGGGRA